MERSELLKKHYETCTTARNLMDVKNQDYGANADPFRNFRLHGLYGIAVRLHDKVARLTTFAEKNTFAVKDESVNDTCLDVINYAILFNEFYNELKNENPTSR